MTEQNHPTKRRGSAQTQRRGDRTRGTPPEKQARACLQNAGIGALGEDDGLGALLERSDQFRKHSFPPI